VDRRLARHGPVDNRRIGKGQARDARHPRRASGRYRRELTVSAAATLRRHGSFAPSSRP
jgi:hypothetical protein